jgi:hypothetical protein
MTTTTWAHSACVYKKLNAADWVSVQRSTRLRLRQALGLGENHVLFGLASHNIYALWGIISNIDPDAVLE